MYFRERKKAGSNSSTKCRFSVRSTKLELIPFYLKEVGSILEDLLDDMFCHPYSNDPRYNKVCVLAEHLDDLNNDTVVCSKHASAINPGTVTCLFDNLAMTKNILLMTLTLL